MSKYSGKFDCADLIDICGGFKEFMKRSPEIRISESKIPLKIEKIQDVIPYYPYVITLSISENGRTVYWLSSESWVDTEERECGHHAIHDCYREELAKEMEKYN